MNGPSLSATYTGPWVPEDRWWVRLEQEPITDDVATVPATANYLDAVFRIDACNPEQEATAAPSEETALAEVAGLDFVICGQDADGSVEVNIKVIRSHQEEGYRLHVAGGSALASKVIVEEFAKVYPLNSARELELEYPVVGAFAAVWQPDLVTASGVRPDIQRHGNTLYWPEEATGSLHTAYLTTYDQVTIRVDGVDGKPGAATVRVVFHGLASDLVPELPDPADLDHALCWHVQSELAANTAEVTCYKSITRVKRCNCSKDEVDSETQDEVVPCPHGAPEKCPGSHSRCMHLLGSETITEYVDCSGDSEIPGRPGQFYAVASREYYKKQCCEYPSFELPQCPEMTESYKGGKKISGGEAQYRTIYGDSVSFVPVTPKGGTCGEHITKQIIEAESCCESIPQLQWDDANSPDYIAKNSSVIVRVADGAPPFRWSISSAVDINFASGGTSLETDSRSVLVVSGPDSCGSASITVTDACDTTVNGSLIGPTGNWTRIAVYGELSGNPIPAELLHIGIADSFDGSMVAKLRIGDTEYRQEISVCQMYAHSVVDPNNDPAVCAGLERADYYRDVDNGPVFEPTCDDRYFDDQGEAVWATMGLCQGYTSFSVMDPPNGVAWFDPPYGYDITITPPDKCMWGEYVAAGNDSCQWVHFKIYYGRLEVWEWVC